MNAPFNMADTIIAKSDQLNADDLLGGPRTITIRKVSAGDSAEQPVNIYYDGDDNKPFRPCKTIRRVMVGLWGGDANKYIGRSMTLIRDASVSFGGMQVGGIRISHMGHINGEQTVVVMKTKGKKAPIKIKPLAVAEASQSDAGKPFHEAEQDAPADGPSDALQQCLDAIAAVKSANGLADVRKRDTRIYKTLNPSEQSQIRQALAARDAEMAAINDDLDNNAEDDES